MSKQEQNNIFEVLENFKTAVTNGQIRLSLEYLVPIIDAIIESLTDGDSEEEETITYNIESAPAVVEEIKVEESKKVRKKLKISVAAGPCLASDLSNRVFTNVIFANRDISVVRKLSKMISTSYYKINCSKDIMGVAVCGGIKNIYAMIVGTSMGINLKNEKDNKNLNTAAALFNQSVKEMCHFIKKIGGQESTVMNLAGVGDLYVSCTGGRNSKMGKFIGMGMTYKNAKKIKMPKDTVEGADLIFDIGNKIIKDFKVKELPLITTFIKALLKNTKFKIDKKLFS